jgi:uncharacterized protein involved in exopolysaccharide biosynthesis
MNNKSTMDDHVEAGIFLYWRIIKKRRKFIGIFISAVVILTMIVSFSLPNIYGASAIIVPVSSKDTGSSGIAASLLQQVGGLPGISAPESASSTEIVTLLKSNILREKVITNNDLMPALFPDKWDNKNKKWRAEGLTLNPFIKSNPANKGRIPNTWDGLRKLDKTVTVMSNIKDKTIVISAESENPALAAQIVGYFLSALNEHMSSEAKRVAMTNRKYLEEQLLQTADPFIRQKIYNMIAQQIETSMMAEVKENFAFKIIDPPKVPDKKIKPQRFLMVMISLVASLLLSVFFVFWMEYREKMGMQNRIQE